MRIVVASIDYPPASTEGVARQRQVLAESLVRLGHDVHVVTRGPRRESVEECGVRVHRYATGDLLNEFLPALPVLNRPLTDAQLLCEAVLDLARREPIDIIDVPLWLAQPLALVRHAPCPVVVWLQTSLLQLVELQGRDPRPHEEVLAAIDRFGLTRAARCIADSRSIVDEVERLYELTGLASRSSVVYPGMPHGAPALARRRSSAHVEALVVGRLEQRKGTRLLFDLLPAILSAAPTLSIRFVGRDNSASDGFHRETGLSYPDFFRSRFPELTPRVRFDGYVDDQTLDERYGSADLLLHPALYESFGLIFLEAMRASLPVVTFRTGGAREVFGDSDDSGAILCEPNDPSSLADAVSALAADGLLRQRMGQDGRQAFVDRFTSDRMARETAAVYQAVVAAPRRAAAPSRRRVFQVMEALQDRDAVSRIARTNARMLESLGAERPILSLFADPAVRHETGRIRSTRFRPGDSAIFHYWGFSRLEGVMSRFPGRKALHYHNITPPHFFSPRTPHYEMTSRGYAQLDRIAGTFDLVIGDSRYNLLQYARHLPSPRPSLCLYPVVDACEIRAAAWDRRHADRLRHESDGPIWLFVGRFAPNKRQAQVMLAFEEFVSAFGRGRLLMIGDTTAVPAYVEQLEGLRARLRHGSRMTLMPSVTDEVLRASYRVADLFVCASEHEGFCLPLAEAMVFGVPTIALDRGAVAETLGHTAAIVRSWDPAEVAVLAADIVESPARRSAITASQHDRLRAFSPDAVREGLRAVVAFLRDGIELPDAGGCQPAKTAAITGELWSTSMN